MKNVKSGCFVYKPFIAALCALFLLCASKAWAASPDAVLETVTSTIAIEKEAHRQGAQWEQEQAELQEKIRQARLEDAWYALQVKTFTRYVNTANERVDDLTRTRDELTRMEAELEGMLVEHIEWLSSFVRQDAPFLQDERESRLQFLHDTINDYELTGAEKLRRTLEAMQVELAYGKNVEVAAQHILIDEEPHNVQVLRLGRAGLFALSPDGKRAWRWQQGIGFAPLDEEYAATLKSAVTMLESGSVGSLPVLPFGGVK